MPLLPNGDRDLRLAIWGAISADELVIVDADGDTREANSEADINLTSSVQRLQRRSADTPDDTIDVDDTGGDTTDDAGDDTTDERREKRVSATVSLTLDVSNRARLRLALDAIRNAVDSGGISWIQITFNCTADESADVAIETEATNAGLHSSVTDL